MSKKRTVYTAKFKTRLVLEVLKGESTLNEIASKNNIMPKNLQNWKKIFMDNAELAMEPSKAIKEYKDANEQLKSNLDDYAKIVGKMTIEKEWLEGKLQSLDLSDKRELIEPKLTYISISTQCKLIKLNPSSLYYKPIVNEHKLSLKEKINDMFSPTILWVGFSLKDDMF